MTAPTPSTQLPATADEREGEATLDVLVACECSGVVREAFNAYSGVNAVSCDVAPPSDGRVDYHLQCDALDALRLKRWHLVIAHPPCTRMALSGALRLYRDGKKANGRDPKKWEELDRATSFFRSFFDLYDGPLCVENPVMHGHARERIGEPEGVIRQVVQPYDFGDDASKATVLWLRGLPQLHATERVAPRHVCPKCGNTTREPESSAWRDRKGYVRCHKCPETPRKLSRWANQTDSGQNKLAPSETRAAERAVTYPGIAQAMASRWIKFLCR